MIYLVCGIGLILCVALWALWTEIFQVNLRLTNLEKMISDEIARSNGLVDEQKNPPSRVEPAFYMETKI